MDGQQVTEVVQLANTLTQKDYVLGGVLLLILAVVSGFVWILFKKIGDLVQKLFEVIKNNTEVISEFKSSITTFKENSEKGFDRIEKKSEGTEALLMDIKQSLVNLGLQMSKLVELIERSGKGNGN